MTKPAHRASVRSAVRRDARLVRDRAPSPPSACATSAAATLLARRARRPPRPQRGPGDGRAEEAPRSSARERTRPAEPSSLPTRATGHARCSDGTEDRHRRRDPDPDPGDDRRGEQMEVADRQDAKPSRSPSASPAHAPRIAADDDDRQPTAGVAADQDVQRRRGRYRRGPPGRAPARCSSSRRRRAGGPPLARGRADRRAGPARAIRPPPRTTSPSYRTAA